MNEKVINTLEHKQGVLWCLARPVRN